MKFKYSLFAFFRQLFSVGHSTAEWNKILHVKIIEMSSECIELQSLVEELENENVQMLMRRNLTHKKLMDFIYKKYPTLLTSAGLINIKKAYLITIETQPASTGVVALEPFDSRS